MNAMISQNSFFSSAMLDDAARNSLSFTKHHWKKSKSDKSADQKA